MCTNQLPPWKNTIMTCRPRPQCPDSPAHAGVFLRSRTKSDLSKLVRHLGRWGAWIWFQCNSKVEQRVSEALTGEMLGSISPRGHGTKLAIKPSRHNDEQLNVVRPRSRTSAFQSRRTCETGMWHMMHLITGFRLTFTASVCRNEIFLLQCLHPALLLCFLFPPSAERATVARLPMFNTLLISIFMASAMSATCLPLISIYGGEAHRCTEICAALRRLREEESPVFRWYFRSYWSLWLSAERLFVGTHLTLVCDFPEGFAAHSRQGVNLLHWALQTWNPQEWDWYQ